MKEPLYNMPDRCFYSHVRETEHGIPLLDYLTNRFPRFDREGWLGEIRSGRVLTDGIVVPPDQPLKKHSKVVWTPLPMPEPECDPSFRTVYEDPYLVIFDKSGDLCVHPTGPFYRNTLWYLAGRQYGPLRFVNRLDRETSGLVAAARDRHTAALSDNGGTLFRKEYHALVSGHFSGRTDADGRLVRDESSAVPKKKRFLYGPGEGESARTVIEEVRYFPDTDRTLVKVLPVTGRQHQIRATLYSLGFPLCGDKLYGPDERIFLKISSGKITREDRLLLGMDRQALHASALEFRHPVTGQRLCFRSPVPFLPEKI